MRKTIVASIFALSFCGMASAAEIDISSEPAGNSDFTKEFWSEISNVDLNIETGKFKDAQKAIELLYKKSEVSSDYPKAYKAVLITLKEEVKRRTGQGNGNVASVLRDWPQDLGPAFNKYEAIARLNTRGFHINRGVETLARAYNITRALEDANSIKQRATATVYDVCYNMKSLPSWDKSKIQTHLKKQCEDLNEQVDFVYNWHFDRDHFIKNDHKITFDDAYVMAKFSVGSDSDGKAVVEVDVLNAVPLGTLVAEVSERVTSNSKVNDDILNKLKDSGEVLVYFDIELTRTKFTEWTERRVVHRSSID